MATSLEMLERNNSRSGPPPLLALGGDINIKNDDHNLLLDGMTHQSRQAGSICWSKSIPLAAELPRKHSLVQPSTSNNGRLPTATFHIITNCSYPQLPFKEWRQRHSHHGGLAMEARSGGLQNRPAVWWRQRRAQRRGGPALSGQVRADCSISSSCGHHVLQQRMAK